MPIEETKKSSRWSFTRKIRFAISFTLGMLAVMTILAFWSARNFLEDLTQQNNLSGLPPLIQQRLDLLQKAIQNNRGQGFDAVKAQILTNNGFQLTGQIFVKIVLKSPVETPGA